LASVQARTGTLFNQRTLIVIDEGAQAEVWEQYLSGSDDLDGVFNTVVELIVADNARLRYICGQGLSERSWIFGAQRAEVGRDAFQESRNLLISKRAHADAIPGLEIQANDVRCTHAAAVAQVDPEQLFYLRSHGLGEDVAKRLVIEGFLSALVERFEQGPVREQLAGTLERRLSFVLGG